MAQAYSCPTCGRNYLGTSATCYQCGNRAGVDDTPIEDFDFDNTLPTSEQRSAFRDNDTYDTEGFEM